MRDEAHRLRRGRLPRASALILRTRARERAHGARQPAAARSRAPTARTRDFTLNTLRQALAEVVACFPVYRTYIADTRVAAGPPLHRLGGRAARSAAATRPTRASSISCAPRCSAQAARRRRREPGAAYRAFAMKFQQFTAPVTAKGVEDTALLPLQPAGLAQRGRRRPGPLRHHRRGVPRREPPTARATGRTRCSPPPRTTPSAPRTCARASTCSPRCRRRGGWRLRRWSRLNRSQQAHGATASRAPSRNDEYLLYQTLLGSLPAGALDDAALAAYRERIQAYMLKAVREAKVAHELDQRRTRSTRRRCPASSRRCSARVGRQSVPATTSARSADVRLVRHCSTACRRR